MSITVHTSAFKNGTRHVSIDGVETDIIASKQGKNWVVEENNTIIGVVKKFREVEGVIAKHIKNA